MQLLQNDVDTLKCENDIRQQNLKALFFISYDKYFQSKSFPPKKVGFFFFFF